MGHSSLRFITKNVLALHTSTGETIDWHSQHLVLPLDQELHMQAGQTMRVRFRYRPGDPIETLASAINLSDRVTTTNETTINTSVLQTYAKLLPVKKRLL